MNHPNDKSVILIVDENIDDLRALGNLLKDQGDILFATSSQSGLMMAAKRHPNLIIISPSTDIDKASVVEFCRTIKNQKETQNCNIAVISSGDDMTSQALELNVLEAGAVDFIRKPYSEAVVKARMKTHANQARQQNRLQNLADKDGLTGVFNRRYFDIQSRVEIKRHTRQRQAITLALLDIDNFKSYNDHYGHLQGDTCLKEVAHALQASSRRPGEYVARYGGEEFAIVLPNTGYEDAKKYGSWICERIQALAIPHAHSNPTSFISVSTGLVSATPDSETSIENLIVSADLALYHAKRDGRNQFKMATICNQEVKVAS